MPLLCDEFFSPFESLADRHMGPIWNVRVISDEPPLPFPFPFSLGLILISVRK